MKKLKINNLNLKNQLLLSPMLDITNLPFRLLCYKAGAALCYTEMIYNKAILYENVATRQMMKTCYEEKPTAIQITGADEKDFEKIIPYLKDYDLVDINCGCPSDRIVGNDSGSFLLRNPKKIVSFIKIIKNAGYTVSTKIRLGYKKNNVIKTAKAIEKAGADAITVHARLASQGYNVPADWRWIAKVKQNVGIPLIGNGDINSGEKAAQMLEIADGAMIGRAAIGDPGIFSRVLHYLKTGKEQEFDFRKNLDYFKEYIKLAEKYEVADIKRIKHLGGYFLRSAPGVARLRYELMQKKSIDEIKEFVRRI